MSTLWAVHVEGPDDIVACEDHEAALKMADGLEGYFKNQDPSLPAVVPVVIEWPWDRVSHALAIEQQECCF